MRISGELGSMQMNASVPVYALSGSSILFGDAGRDKSGDDNDLSRRNSRLTLGQDREFISSTGEVVKLRKRSSEVIGNSAKELLWREDETYGININVLLDKIACDEAAVASRTVRKSLGRSHQLWVEKWRPKRFLDLVGNEKTNRRVLRWLRQWSQAVFNEPLPKNLYENEFDPLQRPQKRILLMHGTPGIGKTSVAHVVAKQAGYSVVEINASDERGGIHVKDKVLNTLFNHTFNESPVCLVADEIDGTLEGGFIKVLVDIVNADSRATKRIISNPVMTTRKSKGQKKAKQDRLLLRPIIAVCNNLYAPVLEKLKPFCEIVAFRRPADSSLADRLDTICRVEGLKMSSQHIKDLIELSQGDVRNCVNNLQFLASEQKLEFDPTPRGKDYSWSWFSLVNALFQRDPRRDSKEQLLDLSKQIELSGNYDRIVQGCHTIYPQVKYSDNGVCKPAQLADWLYFHDLMHKSMFQHNGELLRYCGVVPLQFAHMFGDNANRDDVMVKNSAYEFRESQKTVMDIAQYVAHQTVNHACSVQSFTSHRSLMFEVLPYVDHMIAIDVTKCKSLKVKQSIYETLVDLLQSFQLNITEKNHELLEGKRVLGIEPPIDQIVLLEPKRKAEVFTRRPAALKFLLVKLEENKARKRHLHQVTESRQKNEQAKHKRAKTGVNPGNMVDFFKTQYGIKEPSKSNTNENNLKREEHKDDEIRIWVRYKEGFSDAVRKTVTWNGLWT